MEKRPVPSGLLLLAVAGWAFGAVTEDVLDQDDLARLDGPVLAWVAGHRAAWLTGVVRVVSGLGSNRVLVPLLALVGVAVGLRARRWALPAVLALVQLGATGSYLLVKQAVDRPRPPVAALVDVHNQLGFPSGHATQAAAFWGVLAWLAVRLSPRRRSRPVVVAVWTAALCVTLAVGGSRVYLGVHWPTDVLGGWALGGLWLALVLLAWTTLERRGGRPARPDTTDLDARR
jgi:membrane-associated phospholipid phosphatase